jgi:hypothetical protein
MDQEGLEESLSTQGESQAVEPHKPKNPAYRVWRDVPAEVRQERLRDVMQRWLDDGKLEDIAKDHNLSKGALCMALLEYAEDEWKQAQIARAIARVERAKAYREEMFKGEREPTKAALNLARDDEKSAQWELEKLNRRLFGQDQQAETGGRVSITLNIGAWHKDEKVVSNQ